MRRLFTTTLGQILTIIICSALATVLLFMAALFFNRTPPPVPPWPWGTAQRIVSLIHVLERVPETKRGRILPLAPGQLPNLSVTMKDRAEACTLQSLDASDLQSVLLAELPRFPGLTVRACRSDDPASAIQVLVPMDARMLEVRTGNLGPGPYRFRFFALRVLPFIFISIVTLSIWAIWRVVRPLRRLSEKVDAFGHEVAPTPIEEEGSTEIRNLARAFNLMQERITRSMQERTRMLAAINHDLRTPLTRMRLHLEIARTDVDPEKLLRNIDLMQKMVASAFAFINSGIDDERHEWVDLDALLSTLCDEYEESGAIIAYEGPGQIRFHCRPNALQRALINLIENALHFGRSVTVKASIENRSILIEVADDGPGIPSEHLQTVLDPFVRLDTARNNRPGSVGLGLSIVREIVQAHGGTLALVNRHATGLVARIVFQSPQQH